MAGTNKQSANELFGKIASYSTIVQQNLGKFLNKLSPYAKEYESTLDLILDILKVCGHDEKRLTIEILDIVIGDSSIGALLESGYHGALNSLESKLSLIESKQNNNSFIAGLEDAVKVIISTILTSFLTCSVSPFIPKRCLDKYYKMGQDPFNPDINYSDIGAINIPTNILDFSNTLHVSPVSESGIYFYNTGSVTKFYQRDDGRDEPTTATKADIKDRNAETYRIYTYNEIKLSELKDEDKKKCKKVVSVPREVKVKKDERPPAEFIYIVRPMYTAESLFKTDDMNAFIWYVANRGDNFDEGTTVNVEDPNILYEYNKMAWDSRRINARDEEKRRKVETDDWQLWLASRTSFDCDQSNGILKLQRPDEEDPVDTLYPILQLEPSEGFGHLEHIIATFPAQRYLITKKLFGRPLKITRTIYKFNADYLRSIKIFNWKTIIMNLLYELNGISPIPDIQFNLSLSDEIIDARLSTLILDTITADDKEVDDSYYSFSNEEYSEALKRMEIKKYGAKPYGTVSAAAIQNNPDAPMDAINQVSTAATLNEISSTITRGVYSVAGDSGSTGITKTTLSASLAFESNFINQLLVAIVKPFVRALLSPQIMLLFCINLEVMGLINLNNLGKADMDLISDFIFRKLAGIIKKLIIFVKDRIILYLFDIVKKEIKKLVDEIIILMLLEQLNDYIRLLNQIMEMIRRFGIGKTITGIDEVNYADIIPEANGPKIE